jgi:hypothetical protein
MSLPWRDYPTAAEATVQLCSKQVNCLNRAHKTHSVAWQHHNLQPNPMARLNHCTTLARQSPPRLQQLWVKAELTTSVSDNGTGSTAPHVDLQHQTSTHSLTHSLTPTSTHSHLLVAQVQASERAQQQTQQTPASVGHLLSLRHTLHVSLTLTTASRAGRTLLLSLNVTLSPQGALVTLYDVATLTF